MTQVTVNDFDHQDGDSLSYVVTVNDAAGSPKSLASVTEIIFRAVPAKGNATAVNLTLGSGVVITDSANGIVTITIPKAQLVTEDGDLTRWYYSLRIEESTDSLSVLKGVIKVDTAPAVPV